MVGYTVPRSGKRDEPTSDDGLVCCRHARKHLGLDTLDTYLARHQQLHCRRGEFNLKDAPVAQVRAALNKASPLKVRDNLVRGLRRLGQFRS